MTPPHRARAAGATGLVALLAFLGSIAVRSARAEGDRPAAGTPVGVAAGATRDGGRTRDDDECRAARRDWSEAAAAAQAPLDGLEDCLATGTPACGADLAAVRSTVAELSAHEQRIGWACGSRP